MGYEVEVLSDMLKERSDRGSALDITNLTAWFRENGFSNGKGFKVKKRWSNGKGDNNYLIEFDQASDALLFKLTWGGH
jgi:hypothetical protein